jgi:hypothetical protein
VQFPRQQRNQALMTPAATSPFIAAQHTFTVDPDPTSQAPRTINLSLINSVKPPTGRAWAWLDEQVAWQQVAQRNQALQTPIAAAPFAGTQWRSVAEDTIWRQVSRANIALLAVPFFGKVNAAFVGEDASWRWTNSFNAALRPGAPPPTPNIQTNYSVNLSYLIDAPLWNGQPNFSGPIFQATVLPPVTPPPPVFDVPPPPNTGGGPDHRIASRTWHYRTTTRPVYVSTLAKVRRDLERQEIEALKAREPEPARILKPKFVEPIDLALSRLGPSFAMQESIERQTLKQREAQQAIYLKRQQDDEAIAILLLS